METLKKVKFLVTLEIDIVNGSEDKILDSIKETILDNVPGVIDSQIDQDIGEYDDYYFAYVESFEIEKLPD